MPKSEPMDTNEPDPDETLEDDQQTHTKIRISNYGTLSSNGSKTSNVMSHLQKQNQSETPSNDITDSNKTDSVSMWIKQDSNNSSPMYNALTIDAKDPKSDESPNSSLLSPDGTGQKSMRRRIRRKHNSPDDQAEALTEMSVRGLNLFRYASIQDGVYKCTECAKENVQKTFKNKYSFQRHAFLYHEGTQRKVFPCPVCRKEFSRPDKMKNHMKMTHDCYMPKECKFPLPLIIAGSSQSTQPINNNILNIKAELSVPSTFN